MQQRKKPVTFFMSQAFGAPEGTRTPDLLIRSQTLYPAELPARNVYYNTIRFAKCQALFQKKFLLFLNWAAGPISGLYACNSGVNVINL